MRNYESQHVRNKLLFGRRIESVCPFPGKYPLRITWTVRSKNMPELNARYFGKFLASAWKSFVASGMEAASRDIFSTTQFSLFDRGGEVLGGNAFSGRMPNATTSLRYFPNESVRDSAYLSTIKPFAVGPYWIYASEPPNEREIAFLRRQIETVIPTLRNR